WLKGVTLCRIASNRWPGSARRNSMGWCPCWLAGSFRQGHETNRNLTSMQTLLRNVLGRGFDSRRLHYHLKHLKLSAGCVGSSATSSMPSKWITLWDGISDPIDCQMFQGVCRAHHASKTRADISGKAQTVRRIVNRDCDARGFPLDKRHSWNRE